MTIILVIIIIFCFGLIGYKLSTFYINRKKFFSSMQVLMSNLELDVSFSQDKLKNLIKKNSENVSSKELNVLCENVFGLLDKKQKIDYEIFNEIKILKKEEKDIIFSFFSSLGRFDASSQSKEIKMYQNKIDELYDVSNDECKKYASLFIKLGIIFGILVCLLII